MTSHDLVALVRRQLPRKTKVGHLGTLDPAAAGVLPLAVGGATKLIPLLPNLGGEMKGYIGHLRLGITTDTDDLEGEILHRAPRDAVAKITREDLERKLFSFQGETEQIPPQVSAVKNKGKRAYELAREGTYVELKARRIQINTLKLLEYDKQLGLYKIFMSCGSGTYVRSLARDLGTELGLGGALSFLLRTHSGPFHLHESLSIEECFRKGIAANLVASEFPFLNIPKIDTLEKAEQKGQILNGDFRTDGLFRVRGGLVESEASNPNQAIVVALFENEHY